MSTRLVAAALALGLPFAATTVRAKPAPSAAAEAEQAASGCEALRDDADEGRFACVPDRTGGQWAVRLDAPAPGARDLTLSATYVDARGARTPFSARVEGAAARWHTIAPVEHAARVAPDGSLSVELTRVGFREYPVARMAFSTWQPAR